MNDKTEVSPFRNEIERRIEKALAALLASRQHLAQTMTDLEVREQQFNRRARQLPAA